MSGGAVHAVSADPFDYPDTARKTEAILTGLLPVRSPGLSIIARETRVREAANEKAIQRFLKNMDL